MNSMKKYIRLGFYILLAAFMASSCEKIEPLQLHNAAGNAFLTASTSSIAAVMADSSKTAISFEWTNPNYSVDSNTVKYIVEIDSSGRNFSKAAQKVMVGTRSTSFTAKEINDIALGFGFAYNKQYNIEARVVSSMGNNNERKISNAVALKITPYVVPPKVMPPSSKMLFLVGSATAGGWNNPVPVPSQQFTRLDSVTYEGTFYMKGGQQYLCLPVNGDWSNKYSVKDNNAAGLNKGGDFGFNLSDNFPGPDKTGTYKIRLDFQGGKFSVTLVQEYGLLYVAGDYQGWNPGQAPQLASPKKDGVHEGYVFVKSGGTYEFKLTSQADWSGTNYGDAGSGNMSTSGGNMKFPGAGFYKINANTTTNKFSITKTTWTMIGGFTGWGSDVAMTLNNSNVWEGQVTVTGKEEFKFRANNDWPINLGDNGADNSLEADGANLVLPAAGTYKISLDLNNPGFYTYKIVKQ